MFTYNLNRLNLNCINIVSTGLNIIKKINIEINYLQKYKDFINISDAKTSINSALFS